MANDKDRQLRKANKQLGKVWTDKEEPGNYKVEINWKEYNHKLILIGDFPEDQEYKLDQIEDGDFQISIMKSHIQKCVRRKLNVHAVRSSYHLLTIDFNQFIVIIIGNLYLLHLLLQPQKLPK